jgi:hypothetical protein
MTDTLRAGERLVLDQRLVSANGRYTLVLQTDSNLVLYHDAVDVTNAYWTTGTNWLPLDQRPTHLDLQGDAHLVMYDANGVPRWASGTWGPGFVDPRLVLQDDGNLVIYHDGGTPVWASGTVGGTGAIPPVGFVPKPETIDIAVANCGRMPAVVTGSTDVAAPTSTTVDAGGVAYIITEQRRRLVNDVVEHAFLQDIAGMGVWPGQVIQGKSLLAGDVAPVGPLPRRPGTIDVVTDVITNSPSGQSAKIASPDSATVNEARRDIIRALNPTDAPGLLKTDFQKASTLREVGAKLGISVKGSAFGVDANATLDQTHKESTVVASIRQVFYTVTYTPDGPQASGIWSESEVDHGDLQPFMGTGNPPLYIDSVQYGRFICVTAQGSFSSSDITAALKAHWEASVSGSANVDVRTKEVLESSQIKIYTLGVPGHANFQSIADPIAELQQVYRSGLTLTTQNLGAPISFTCRHVADGTLAHVGLAAEYTQPLSAVGENVSNREFQVFDGPGGGLVDTGLSVNPGDQVTIHAEGQVWSGVFLSGTHGPEGWPGHKADPAAPMPQGTAYCLVARFGNGAWFEAGPFWQGSPAAGTAGRLLLNVNDNNPYNGNPKDQWTVHVDVQRAGAAAAGIYV